MKRLGRVLRVTRRGLILVKATAAPPIDAKILDAKGRFVGRVYDIFGPVKAPYVLVKPSTSLDELKSSLKGAVYFPVTPKRRFKSWKRVKRK
ncbi:MAG: Gar1/Naf1 family protein [archaeon GB-1867-005]|nr:Gar1/Naf1 family protein [Candidatus Culexmicrobium cathedralense]